MATKSSVIETNEELAEKWGKSSSAWDRLLSPFFLPTAATLISSLLLNDTPKAAILEVGCGSGDATALCNSLKPRNAKLAAIDISPEMVNLAKHRVNDSSVSITVASADSLPYPDGSINRYYSSFALHLVPDADAMLKESVRVLVNGSIAAFSVWGRREHSSLFSIVVSVAQEMGISMPSTQIRSPFYLGADADALKQKVLAAGFDTALGWYQPLQLLVSDGDDYVRRALSQTSWVNHIKSLPVDTAAEFKARVSKVANERLAAGNTISLDVLIVVARKGVVKTEDLLRMSL